MSGSPRLGLHDLIEQDERIEAVERLSFVSAIWRRNERHEICQRLERGFDQPKPSPITRPGGRDGAAYDAQMHSRGHRIGLLLVVVAVVAACDPSRSTTTPASTAETGAPAASSSTRTAVASTGGNQASQTDTDWGRIWDSLPNGFPRYAGSTPGDEAATGAASAILLVQTADAKGIATFFKTALENGGYRTDGLSGPLEDGGYVLDMTGPNAGCKLQVTAAPTGGLTTVKILYGAACPLT